MGKPQLTPEQLERARNWLRVVMPNGEKTEFTRVRFEELVEVLATYAKLEIEHAGK